MSPASRARTTWMLAAVVLVTIDLIGAVYLDTAQGALARRLASLERVVPLSYLPSIGSAAASSDN